MLSLRVAETIIDKAIELKAIGGVYGNQKPTEFLCLLLKLLQLQPEKEILLEYLQADEFKYVSNCVTFSRSFQSWYCQVSSSACRVLRTDDFPTCGSLRNPGTPVEGLPKTATSGNECVVLFRLLDSSLIQK